MVIGLVALVLYLIRAATLEKLLPPAVSAITLIVAMALAGQSIAVELVVLAAVLAFVGSGAYLVIQGEFRAGLRALTKREIVYNASTRNKNAFKPLSSQQGWCMMANSPRRHFCKKVTN